MSSEDSVSYLSVSVGAHPPRIVCESAPVSVVKILVAILAAEVGTAVTVVHGHALVRPLLLPAENAASSAFLATTARPTGPSRHQTLSSASQLTCPPCRTAF